MSAPRAAFAFALAGWAPTSARSAAVGAAAPDVVIAAGDSTTLRLSDLRGEVVIVDFWASWCGPCRQEMPVLVDLHEKHGEAGLHVVAVNVDRKRGKADGFLAKLSRRPAFPIVFDPEGEIPRAYEPEGMPTTYFVDRRGVVRYVQSGFKESDLEIYEERIGVLLGEANAEPE